MAFYSTPFSINFTVLRLAVVSSNDSAGAGVWCCEARDYVGNLTGTMVHAWRSTAEQSMTASVVFVIGW